MYSVTGRLHAFPLSDCDDHGVCAGDSKHNGTKAEEYNRLVNGVL